MIRFLYSPISKIMSIHYLGLTPSAPQEKTAYKDFVDHLQENEFQTPVPDV